MRGNRDLLLASGASVSCALLALALPVEALSLLFAAPLAFVLPGYAIAAAVFVRHQLAAPMLATLSVGLSLVVLALGALVLNYGPGGVRGVSWAILLVVVTVAACRGAALRRPRAGDGTIAFPITRPRGAETALLAGGGLAALAALVLAFATLPANNAIGFTELWIEPYEAVAGYGVAVGVGNNEQRPTAYRLRVRIGVRDAWTVKRFALRPGESRVVRFMAPPTAGGAPQRAVAELFRTDRPDRAYRRVWSWTPWGRPPG